MMTAMCRLVRGPTLHGNVKALSTDFFRKTRSEVSSRSRPRGAQSFDGNSAVRNKSSPKMINEKFLPYTSMFNKKRQEAANSILIEVEGYNETGHLKTICESFGGIEYFSYYKASGKSFVLVEFKEKKGKSVAMEKATFSKNPQNIRVTSPFFYYYNMQKRGRNSSTPGFAPDKTNEIQYHEDTIIETLRQFQATDKNQRLKLEMESLVMQSRVSDLSIRLRFFACHQLDVALGGIYSGLKALPFGSSLSGFGRNSGDLDIFLYFARRSLLKHDKFEFVYHSKSCMQDSSLQLKLVGDIISVLLPGCIKVVSIFSAKVPIIKFHQSFANLDCDLNNSASSGFDLSHIMYIMCNWDPCVAPLVYATRLWASCQNLTPTQKPSPGITNFSLIYMVIFYLQTQGILPSLESFHSLPASSTSLGIDLDSRIVFPDLRKVEKGTLTAVHSTGIDSLLIGFFAFYSKFDFQNYEISLYYGTSSPKTNKAAALYIQNPVAMDLNIAMNVKNHSLLRFKTGAKEALQILGEDFSTKSLSSILDCSPRQTGDKAAVTS